MDAISPGLKTLSECSLLQAQFLGSCLANGALDGEGRHDVGHHIFGESEIVEQELGRLLVLEVPHHALGKSADGSVGHAAQTHGYIVAGEQNLVNLVEQLRLVLLHPCQLGGREVAWRVQQMTEALVGTEVVESLLTIGHGTRVAPDDTRTEHLLVLVDTYQTVHLVGNTDGLDVVCRSTGIGHDFLQRKLGIVPPHLGVLLSPASLDGHDGSFFLGIKSSSGADSSICVYE